MKIERNNEIEVNAGYRLMPCSPGNKRKLCFVCGRQGNYVTLMLVCGLMTVDVSGFDHEYAKVKLVDGDYNLMPCNKVTDMNEVADVCDIIRNCP